MARFSDFASEQNILGSDEVVGYRGGVNFRASIDEIISDALTARNFFTLAISPGRTGDALTDLATAQANRAIVATTIAAMKAAIAAGASNCTLVFPAQDWLVASAPATGTSPPSVGVSAVGGGHYVGTGSLPLSNGWATACIWLDEIDGFRIEGRGGKIMRVENDPYNTVSANDQFNATILITRCTNFTISGTLEGEGYQQVSTSATSGNFLDISYGCQYFDVAATVINDKGTNALAIGVNRASGFSDVVGVSGYDILQPCLDWTVSGSIIGYNGEHAAFINVSDRAHINYVKGAYKPFSYGGVSQAQYIQRGLYLLSCGRITVGAVDSYDAHKAGVLLTAYDSRRAYKDLDAEIGTIFVQAPTGQDSDYYIGVCPNDQCTDPAYLRTISANIGKLTTRGVKNGVLLLDAANAAMATTTTLEKLHVGEVDIEATANGFVLGSYGQVADIVIGKGTIRVKADATYHASSAPVSGLQITSTSQEALGASAAAFNKDVRIGQVLVNSGNRATQIAVTDGLTISGLVSNYVAEGVSGAVTVPLRFNYCKTYGAMDYRTNDGTVANQSSVLQVAPAPVRGVYRRSGTLADPGSMAAGASASSNLTVTGARVGMPAMVTLGSAATGIVVRAVVTGDDAVTVTLFNASSGAQSPGALTYYLDVFSTLAAGT